jgi:hypothetical protein
MLTDAKPGQGPALKGSPNEKFIASAAQMKTTSKFDVVVRSGLIGFERPPTRFPTLRVSQQGVELSLREAIRSRDSLDFLF